MTKKVAVLVIHGMGSQGINFAEDMIVEVNSRISKADLNPDEIAWKSIFWADIVEPKQTQYMRDTQRNNDIDLIRLRQFVISALGDAAAYQKVGGKESETYGKIHSRVREKIKSLYESELGGVECPLIVMAHSLGGHIMSNYIWDMQHGIGERIEELSSFEKMDNLAGMITFGCNIPLFTFAYNSVVPISFPGQGLSEEDKLKAKWINYYDPDDILGYPLRSINSDYAGVVDRDVPINVGGIISSWNPASHSQYWTDNDFTVPVSKYIGEYLE